MDLRTAVTRFAAILAIAGALAVAASARADDLDEDGIDDELEQTLIDMYRPVLHYDSDESIRPCSVETYIRHSELVYRTFFQGAPVDTVIVSNSQLNDPGDPNSPLGILIAGSEGLPSSMIPLEPSNVGFRINVFDDFHEGGSGPLDAVGMYGRVTPLSGPLIYENGLTLPPINHEDFLLIQYWQFFPFNDFDAPLDGGDHEGDWMWIDLFVERACPHEIHFIVHHHHGDDHCSPSVSGFGSLPPPTRPFPLPCDPANLARVPQCFLEADVHEWWPFPSSGGECEFFEFDNPSHDGLTGFVESQNVLNLGERYAPMPGLEPQLILFFNGLWGSDHGVPNSPPGPPVRQLAPGFPYAPLAVAHVDPNAPSWSDEGLGSRYHPFTSLSEAIDGANAVKTGGRVLLAPQSYPGNQLFTRPMRFERDGVEGTVKLGQ